MFSIAPSRNSHKQQRDLTRLIEQARTFERRARNAGDDDRAERHERIRSELETLAGQQQGGRR